jgi:hypothetical protein
MPLLHNAQKRHASWHKLSIFKHVTVLPSLQSIALIIPVILVYSDPPRRDIDLSRGQKVLYIAKHVAVSPW